jgi:hypothetical protein
VPRVGAGRVLALVIEHLCLFRGRVAAQAGEVGVHVGLDYPRAQPSGRELEEEAE